MELTDCSANQRRPHTTSLDLHELMNNGSLVARKSYRKVSQSNNVDRYFDMDEINMLEES